jgi:DNA-binding GntR family transcriptional regulator
MYPLSTHGKVPLNRQIARDLTDRIRSGDFGPGEPLPSEAQLAATYGVNRLTVRHALTELVQQGLITTARGRRTFVTEPPVRYRIDQAPGASLTSSMAEQGLSVFHEVFETARVAASDAPLALDGARRCVRYRYRRWVDGTPWSRSCTWLVSDLAPRHWDGVRPVLDEVADQHQLEIRRAVRAFVAVPATLDDAEELDVPVGAPLLRVTGTSVDQHGRTVAVVRHSTRGDRAEYVVDLVS